MQGESKLCISQMTQKCDLLELCFEISLQALPYLDGQFEGKGSVFQDTEFNLQETNFPLWNKQAFLYLDFQGER